MKDYPAVAGNTSASGLPYRCPGCGASPTANGRYGCGGAYIIVDDVWRGSCPTSAPDEAILEASE